MKKIDKLVSLIIPELENLELVKSKHYNDTSIVSNRSYQANPYLRDSSGMVIATLLDAHDSSYYELRIVSARIENMDMIMGLLDKTDQEIFALKIAYVILPDLIDNYGEVVVSSIYPNHFISYIVYR
jgi:hypothetical protein